MTISQDKTAPDSGQPVQAGMQRPPAGVRKMFADIAGEYDLFNHTLSLNIDRLWRRKAVKVLKSYLEAESSVLDLCTGTGDLALELQKISPVTGCDFCRPMLEIAGRKIARRSLDNPVRLVEGDGMKLPFASGQFDAVTLAFGFRNMEDYELALREIRRVMGASGLIMILDFSVPENYLFRKIYLFYLTRILPLVGKLLSGIIAPYRYLPDSVKAFPERAEIEALFSAAGFEMRLCRTLTFGIATIYLAGRA